MIAYEVPLEMHLFFFSSRRRHTRLQGNWSSDVCSSDLREEPWSWLRHISLLLTSVKGPSPRGARFLYIAKIGRASCRERVCSDEGVDSGEKKAIDTRRGEQVRADSIERRVQTEIRTLDG